MRNRLRDQLTGWKWWYALFALLAFLVASNLSLVAQVFGAGADPTFAAVLTVVQFAAFALLGLALGALVSRRWPSRRDLAFTPGLRLRDLAVIAAVFLLSHGLFWLLGRMGPRQDGQAAKFFTEMGLDGPLPAAAANLIAVVVMAPVCEELLFRGLILRPVHDHLARARAGVLAPIVAVAVSAVAFALPHVGDSLVSPQAIGYLATGIAFGVVYVLTGSMTAAMVSHSLQSCVAMAQILLFGRGSADVSPVLYAIVFASPLIVFGVARLLAAMLPPHREPERESVA